MRIIISYLKPYNSMQNDYDKIKIIILNHMIIRIR